MQILVSNEAMLDGIKAKLNIFQQGDLVHLVTYIASPGFAAERAASERAASERAAAERAAAERAAAERAAAERAAAERAAAERAAAAEEIRRLRSLLSAQDIVRELLLGFSANYFLSFDIRTYSDALDDVS